MTEFFNLHAIAKTHARLHSQLNQFLLIDLSGCRHMAEKIVHAKFEWCELLDSGRNNIPTALPIIIPIVEYGNIQASKAACDWITECVINNSIASVISTPLRMMELRKRLELRTHARLSGNVDILLRFFDPRVFENLLATLTREQLHRFLAVADAWGYVNRVGQFKEHATVFAKNEDTFEPLVLSQKQEDKLMDLAVADNILYSLSTTASEVLEGIPAQEQYMSVSRAYALAAIDKIESIPAAVLYVATILLKGDAVREAKNWTEFLDRLRAGEFLEACGSFSAHLE